MKSLGARGPTVPYYEPVGRVITCGLERSAVKVARYVLRGERLERVGPTRYMYTVGLDKFKSFLILFSQWSTKSMCAAAREA